VNLLLSVRLLDNRYHGLTDNGNRPEWPPSPFRLFQALVAGNARGTSLPSDLVKALQWLESLDPPEIIAPRVEDGQVVLTYVLNNTDGRSRTPKTIRPSLLDGDRLIQYVWRFDPEMQHSIPHAGVIARSTRHIRALGWGIDMAIGNGEIVDAVPPNMESRIRFVPAEESAAVGIDLRSPRPGSLASLQECYSQFLRRFESNESTQLESGGPIYQLCSYTAGESRPHAVFKLVDENDDAYRYPHAKLIHIAGMVRHLAIEAMVHNPPPWVEDAAEWVNRVVRGKRDESASDEHKQFSYVPLPSIGYAHTDAMIRNVMVVAPLGMERELDYLADRLDGQVLKPESDAESRQTDSAPLLSQRVELQKFTPPRGKFIDACYLGTAPVWHTVTPVILPGHNDKKADKTVQLIQAALKQSGIETPCEFIWQAMPFLKNCFSAHKYDRNGRHTGYHRPVYLKDLTAVHLRLQFEHPVVGPLVIGAGRHCGLGIFAVCE
jgi:CRISPR-associated protein Csb2